MLLYLSSRYHPNTRLSLRQPFSVVVASTEDALIECPSKGGGGAKLPPTPSVHTPPLHLKKNGRGVKGAAVPPFPACIRLPYLQQNTADPPTGRSTRVGPPPFTRPRFIANTFQQPIVIPLPVPPINRLAHRSIVPYTMKSNPYLSCSSLSTTDRSLNSQAGLSFHPYTANRRRHLYHATLGHPRYSWQSDATLAVVNLWNPPTTSQTYVSIGPTLHTNNGMTTCLYVCPRATLVYGLGFGCFAPLLPRP